MSKFLYFNGKIITMEDEDIRLAPEAVLVDNGIIKAVGTLSEVSRAADHFVRRVDLQGKCLMPGFIDPHGHVAMNGQMSVCADLSECESFDKIVEVLKDYIDRNHIKENGMVLGFGYDNNFLIEFAHPDRRVLDRVSETIPIMIMHVSAHLCCVNSAMIRAAGIAEDAPDPEGGHYGRMDDGVTISGYAEEAGMVVYQTVLARLFKPDVRAMMSSMQKAYLENGVTTVQDGATNSRDFQMLTAMAKLHMLKLDVVTYPLMGDDGNALMQDNWEVYKDYHHHLKIGGYKLVLDGSPQGRSAWMSEPYISGEEDYCGYPWMKDEDVQKYTLQAVQEGKQLLAHCNGDAASEQYLNAYEKALETAGVTSDLRPVMIHCQTVRNDQLDRMAKINMIASIFVGHVWYWGDVHVRNFGPERGNHISPAEDALKRGICVNFHTDTPVTKPKMLHSVWCAVNRTSRSGNVIGADQRISVYEALKAITINAAYGYFEENSKGSIRVGKRADLVILDRSPLEVDPMEICDINVIETIKDGKTVYKRN